MSQIRLTPDRSTAPDAVDLAPVSLRRSTGAAVTHSEQWLNDVEPFRRWAVVVEALGGDRCSDSSRDHLGDVDDALPLVDPRFHVIADLDV